LAMSSLASFMECSLPSAAMSNRFWKKTGIQGPPWSISLKQLILSWKGRRNEYGRGKAAL
jgi:hypothetical protein